MCDPDIANLKTGPGLDPGPKCGPELHPGV